MVFLGASLADGQVASTKGTIYTVPAGKRALVNFIRFVSTTATVQTINVYVKRSGSTSRRLMRFANVQQWEAVYPLQPDEEITLSAGDVIEADTTTATAVDYFISGAVEDV